ncbi:MAG: PIN domain-containing protein [Anaerolineaceae bacterium]|nr:PIN domain-containing protein [Anaerolineaceae bacterium]
MSVYVVDASVAVKWFLDEPHSDAALAVLSDRNQLHAPDFFLIEIDSVLCKWIRRGEITEDEGSRIRTALREFPVQRHNFLPLLDPAYAMANRTGCSLYDCLYVALAVLLDGQMVTADRRLYDGLARSEFSEYVVWIEDAAG